MPKHVERDRVHPLPGAFGLERSKSDWERRTRPRDHYLTRRGRYSDYLYVLVEEEYGFLTFLWVYPGTAEELVEDWCVGRVPWICRRGGPIRGEFDSVMLQRPQAARGLPWGGGSLELTLLKTGEVFEGLGRIEDFDGIAHYHEEEDSYLKVGFYEVNGVMDPMVTVRVLDALAAIKGPS